LRAARDARQSEHFEWAIARRRTEKQVAILPVNLIFPGRLRWLRYI
jgi:hypothetical protein